MLTFLDLLRLILPCGGRFPRCTPWRFRSSGEHGRQSGSSFPGADSANASSPQLVPSKSQRPSRNVRAYEFQAVRNTPRSSEYRPPDQYEPIGASLLLARLAVGRLSATARYQPQNHPASLYARAQERRGESAHRQPIVYYREADKQSAVPSEPRGVSRAA